MDQHSGKEAPYRDTALAEKSLLVERHDDGTIILRSGHEPWGYPAQLSEWLRHWAEERSERVFLAERDSGSGWRSITWGEARAKVDSVSHALLARGLGPRRPIMSLGGNSIDLALLKLGAMQVGIPIAPVSPSYSLLVEDYGRLQHIAGLLKPGLVQVPEVRPFSKALAALDLDGVIKVSSSPDAGFEDFESYLEPADSAEIADAYAGVNGDTVAKYLFTSGSTGFPKAAIVTQQMMCANVTGICQLLPVLDEHPPVLMDWLPWNHVAGGNKNFNIILRCGGTMYIDDGRPQPGKFERTIENLREIPPTFMHNVPLVFGLLAPYLEDDPEFAERLFSRMDFIFYAAAPMPEAVQARIDAAAEKATGERIPFLSSLGSTETTPSCILCHWPSPVPGNLGLPLPDVTVKLAPTAGKLEMRVKGPNIISGYLGNPEATEQAFDEEGFFRMGDAVKFVDPDDPEQGLLFDGRVVENFKLATGTWVQTGEVRVAVVNALSPLVRDAAVAGEARDDIGLLLFPDADGIKRELWLVGDAETIALSDKLRAEISKRLVNYNASAGGSSRRIARVMIMTEPPSVNGNEMTDKGYLNQRAVLDRRAGLVIQLYADDPGPDVILLNG